MTDKGLNMDTLEQVQGGTQPCMDLVVHKKNVDSKDIRHMEEGLRKIGGDIGGHLGGGSKEEGLF